MSLTLRQPGLAVPPPAGNWGLPMAMALSVHALLALALTWGVGWKQDPTPVFEAELWSALPQTAAPALVAPPPDTTPEEPPTPEPEIPPPAIKPAPPTPKPPDIVQQKKLEKERKDKEQAAKNKAEKEALARKKAAEEKAVKDKEAQRQAQIQRMLGQAGAKGQTNATGTASQSSGPSASYGGRVAARIRPNVVLTDPVAGNPRAEVEVRADAEGKILSRRLLKSSGNVAWDQAVLRAIDRTGTLPLDTDGRVPSPLIIGLRPLD